MPFIVVKDAGQYGDLQAVETMGYGAAVYATYSEALTYADKLKSEMPQLHVYVAQIVSEVKRETKCFDEPITPPNVAQLKRASE